MEQKFLMRVMRYAFEHRHQLKWKKRLHAMMYGASYYTIATRVK